MVGRIVVGPKLLPDTRTTHPYRDFLGTVLPGLLEDVSLAEARGCGFSTLQLQRNTGNMSGSE
jgi:hypothetical protein